MGKWYVGQRPTLPRGALCSLWHTLENPFAESQADVSWTNQWAIGAGGEGRCFD
jgi:hypothetical protein